jgi:hypothetical protein
MTRRRILLIVLTIVVVMLAIHLSLNGFPDLSSLNPHNR